MRTTERAYAKINLFLNVNNKRPDGFHGITTVMHEVTLCDTLDLACETVDGESVIILHATGEGLPESSEDNLVVKAARKYLFAIKRQARLEITLEKKIPAAAGLGGGSADAAATLRALQRLFGEPLSYDELSELAASLGSDVPFCLLGGTALCLGRGEIVEPIAFSRRLNILLAKSDETVSTPKAYAALDEKYADFESEALENSHCLDELNLYLSGKRETLPELYNIFESVILDGCKNAREIKENILSLGAAAALVSGSGPTVFGIFESEEALDAAELALAKKGVKTFKTTSK